MLSPILALILGGKTDGCSGATSSIYEGWDAHSSTQ